MTPKGKRSNVYTPEERELGMTVLAAFNGNRERAHKALKDRGVHIPVSTLYSWKTRDYPEDYLRIREQELPKIKAVMAEKAEEVAAANFDLSLEITGRMVEALRAGEIDPKDLHKNLKDSTIAGGIGVQRSAELRGEGLLVNHVQDPKATIAALKRLGVIDSEATEEPLPVANLEEST